MKSFAFVAAVVLCSLSTEARAQWPLGSFGYGPYYAPGMYAADTRVPYFALHPPVYYSYPVPRPYGYSPWAYPGWIETPHVPAVEPQTLVNPYIIETPNKGDEPKSPTDAVPTPTRPSGLHKQASAKKAATPEPQVIVNPFYRAVVAGDAR